MEDRTMELISNEHLENNINMALKTYLSYLYNYEYITREDFLELSRNTAIIIKKPSFFGNIWNKILNKNKNDNLFIVVEQKTLIYEELQEEKDKNSSNGDCEIVKFPTNGGEKTEK